MLSINVSNAWVKSFMALWHIERDVGVVARLQGSTIPYLHQSSGLDGMIHLAT